MKTIEIKTPFITLGQFLKYANICSSGASAKEIILLQKVMVNGVIECRRGRKLYTGDKVLVESLEYMINSC